jgi:hypothetical protein
LPFLDGHFTASVPITDAGTPGGIQHSSPLAAFLPLAYPK